MRMRKLKPGFWTAEHLASLSHFSRLLAIALLNVADDEGYFLGQPPILAAQLFPFEKAGQKLVSTGLSDLVRARYIRRFAGNIYAIANFSKHQTIDRRRKSELKPQAVDLIEFVEPSSSPRRALVEPSSNKGKAVAPVSTEFAEVMAAWNEAAGKLGLPRIEAIGEDRARRLAGLVGHFKNGVADILEAIGYIHLNQYWKKKPDKWDPPGFDWLLRNDRQHTVRDLLELGRSKSVIPSKPKAITFAEQIALTDAKFAAEKAEWEARQAAKAEVGT